MDIAFLLGTKIIELTLIVLIGYGLVKSKLLKSEDSKTLSVIGLYVISPSVMIEAFQIDYTPEILQGLQLSLLMAVFLHIILIIIGSLLKRLLKLEPELSSIFVPFHGFHSSYSTQTPVPKLG